MIKRTLSTFNSASGAVTFDGEDYAPDNSQSARRYFSGLNAPEFADAALTLSAVELTAPSDAKSGPGKVMCRVRVSVPQLRLVTPMGVASTLAMTGTDEFIQATLTVTVPAMWVKVLLGRVPASSQLRRGCQALVRMAAIDCVTGVFGDTVPETVFNASVWATLLQQSSPLYRGLQGAIPEDVFNGQYGV